MIEFVDLMEGRSLSLDNENDQDKYWHSEQWIMEPIFFGIRYQGLVNSSGKIDFLGKKKNYKQQNKLYSIEKLVNDLTSYKLPKETLFEGYLTFTNNKNEAHRFLKLETLDQQLLESAEFYLTDLIYCDGSDVFNLPLFERRAMLRRVFSYETEKVKIQQGFVKQKKIEFEKLKDFVNVFLFKDLEASYSFKQVMSCRIYKVPRSYFMVVLDIVESDKDNFKNMCVALRGAQIKNGKLEEIMSIPVHSTDNRIKLYNNRERIKGRVFEFLALEKTDNENKYQEARFVSMREDKKEEDCLF
jgi:hypothetical protein